MLDATNTETRTGTHENGRKWILYKNGGDWVYCPTCLDDYFGDECGSCREDCVHCGTQVPAWVMGAQRGMCMICAVQAYKLGKTNLRRSKRLNFN